jgi:ABC-type glycerol-3-phosphate transport system substrate-binding protein
LSGLHINLWQGLDGKTGATLSKLAAEFSQKNEWGIQVDVLSQKNLSTLIQATDAVMRTPQQPDLVLALPENAQGWDSQGLVANLTPYISHAQFGLSAEEIKDIPAAFWQQDQVNQKQLSVPAMRNGRFLFYNVSFAKQLGFTAPPLTTEDFRKQACAANGSWKTDTDQTNDGFGGLVIENAMTDLDAPWTAYAWLRSQGSDVVTDGNFSFLTPENQASLNFLAELRTDSCAWLSIATSGYEALALHKALFVAGSLTNLRDQNAAFAGSSDKWTVIAFPGTTPSIVTYGPDFVVLKSDEAHQWASWLFIRWMLAPEIQLRWSRETGTFPMRTSTMALLDIRSANPQWAAAFDLLPQASTYPKLALWSKARLVLGDGFFQLFQLAPSANDVSRTLKMMDDTVKDLKP